MLSNEKWDVKPEDKILTLQQQIFLNAASLIEKRGWCQGRAMDGKGRVCLMQAIGRAAGELGVDTFRTSGVWPFVEEVHSRLRRGGTAWNDAPGRTKEEVIAALKSWALDG